MKRSIISAAVLSAVFMSAGVFAADTDSGILNINGRITGTTCHFQNDKNTTSIDMNEIGSDVFTGKNAGYVYTGVKNSTSTPLIIVCDNEDVPKLSLSKSEFDSNDITHNSLTGTDDATGVGFAVYLGETADEAKRVKPGNTLQLKKITDKTYQLDFTAQYAQSGSSVTKGAVSSAVTLTVVTD